ncbi:hypothetical protein [Lonepinella sp. BR2357]|uniref:hypothetical protein n=1 Tax=Lonepinella sp. BR2357 TaxID=3434549 RepID=UPI003F6DB4AC
MKKIALLMSLPILLSSCAQRSFAQNTVLPDYETFEKFASTNNGAEFKRYFDQKYSKSLNSDRDQFKIDPNVIRKAFPVRIDMYDDPEYLDLLSYFKGKVYLVGDKYNALKKETTLGFEFRLSYLDFTRYNFYKVFGLDPNDINIEKINRCKRGPGSWGEDEQYKLTLKSGKVLYLFYSGGYDPGWHDYTVLTIYKNKQSCKAFGDSQGKLDKNALQDFERTGLMKNKMIGE